MIGGALFGHQLILISARGLHFSGTRSIMPMSVILYTSSLNITLIHNGKKRAWVVTLGRTRHLPRTRSLKLIFSNLMGFKFKRNQGVPLTP